MRERRPPFSPEAVTEEYAELIKKYRCTKVYGDRYGGEWPREQFQKYGVNYEPAERTKSELYKDLLPLLNSRAIDLLDNERLVSQLVSLERRTTRGGRDSIDHLPGAHDDLANAVAGALVTAFTDPATVQQSERVIISPSSFSSHLSVTNPRAPASLMVSAGFCWRDAEEHGVQIRFGSISGCAATGYAHLGSISHASPTNSPTAEISCC